jgi:hypothetical protein
MLPSIFSGVRVARSFVLCVVFRRFLFVPLKIEGSIHYSTPASEFGLALSSAIFGFSNI